MIWNGAIKGDEEGEWIYTRRRGESVIDYVLGETDMRDFVERLEIEDRVERKKNLRKWRRSEEDKKSYIMERRK